MDKMQNKIVITAVGDIMLGDLPICNGFGVGSTVKKHGSKFIFEKIKDELSGDIVFGNLEAVLSNENKNIFSIKSMSLRGSPKSIEGLKYAGFNILSLANNHSLEHGYEALYDTIDLLNNNDIMPIGVGREKEIARKPTVFNIKTKKIAFLSYCLRPDETAYRSIKNKEDILDDIEDIRRDVDHIILSLHWGDEFVQFPAPWQIDFAHKLIDNGVSIIIGHHPHVLQGIEMYNGGIIAYSLGNFVFDMWHEEEKIGGILKMYLGEDVRYDFIKTYINNQFQPIPMKNADLPEVRKMDEEEYRESVNYLHNRHLKDYRKFFMSHLLKYNKMVLCSLIWNSLKFRVHLK